jgi:hypothetical protein
MNRGIEVRPRSCEDLEWKAAGTRRTLLPNLSENDAVDGVELFEYGLEDRGPVLLNGSDVTVAVAKLPSELEALIEHIGEPGELYKISLSERSYRWLEERHPRGLFTLAHETGHLVLHRAELRELSTLPHRERVLARQSSTHKAYRDSEWQADYFAAAFMMPAIPVLELGDVDRIRARFGVSEQAAQIRLQRVSKSPDLARCWR